MSILLQCNNLTKYYGKKEALSNLTLSIQSGKIIGLLGPNGSGKTTFIKLANGLLTPTSGTITIKGIPIGPETKQKVAYLPDNTYLNNWMKVREIIDFFHTFYLNFDSDKAYDMLNKLKIHPEEKLKTMSKGTKEKIQLILVMSRNADLYLLDEPIGGVDPAARDYILNTIINNYNPSGSMIISTHLISDIESILDDVIFLQNGHLIKMASAEDIRTQEGKSIDTIFREEFKC